MSWVSDIFNKLVDFLYRALISLVDMFKDMFFWCLERVFEAVDFCLALVVGIFEPIDLSQYINIPSGVAWMMAQVGVPQCLTIITLAITVRLLLQLIPFVRLGS